MQSICTDLLQINGQDQGVEVEIVGWCHVHLNGRVE